MRSVLQETVLIYILCHNVVLCNFCYDIHFGMRNFNICPKNCAECSLQNSCLICETNALGSFCRSKCKLGCIVVFVSNGTILRDCFKEKKIYGCCMTCPGYRFCSDCIQFNGICSRCTSGYYGTDCVKRCSNCRPDKDNRVHCDLHSGFCQADCIDGYFGLRCDQKCSEYCLEHETKVRKCDQSSGKCVFGCITGRYNDKCEDRCSNTCLNRTCDQQTGSCSFGCLPGTYGGMCERDCSEACGTRSCDRNTGVCTKGCVPGRYGERCENKCRSACRNNVCNPLSGNCDNGCFPGWYGDKCESSCSNVCHYKTCNQTSGQCDNGCVPGSYGNMCEKKCRSTCFDNTCNQRTGYCKNGCVSGWFGNTCDLPCAETCNNRTCDSMYGRCTEGCVPGYYGDNCKDNCSDIHGESCNASKPLCIDCEDAISIDFQKKNLSGNKQSTDYSIIYTIVVIVTVCTCLLAVYFIRRFFLGYRKRKESRENTFGSTAMNTIEPEEPIYDEIDDINDETDVREHTKADGDSSDSLRTGPNDHKHTDMTVKNRTYSEISVSPRIKAFDYEQNQESDSFLYRGSYEIPVTAGKSFDVNDGVIGQPKIDDDTRAINGSFKTSNKPCVKYVHNHLYSEEEIDNADKNN